MDSFQHTLTAMIHTSNLTNFIVVFKFLLFYNKNLHNQEPGETMFRKSENK